MAQLSSCQSGLDSVPCFAFILTNDKLTCLVKSRLVKLEVSCDTLPNKESKFNCLQANCRKGKCYLSSCPVAIHCPAFQQPHPLAPSQLTEELFRKSDRKTRQETLRNAAKKTENENDDDNGEDFNTRKQFLCKMFKSGGNVTNKFKNSVAMPSWYQAL